MASQSRGRPNLGNFRQNAIWMWTPWAITKYTIRGKVVASPKSGSWWVLWVWVCSWFVLTPKVFQLCINHLVLVLCKHVWVNAACHFFLVPSQNSSTSLYPFEVLQGGEHGPTLYSFDVFYSGLTFESLEKLGACQIYYVLHSYLIHGKE